MTCQAITAAKHLGAFWTRHSSRLAVSPLFRYRSPLISTWIFVYIFSLAFVFPLNLILRSALVYLQLRRWGSELVDLTSVACQAITAAEYFGTFWARHSSHLACRQHELGWARIVFDITVRRQVFQPCLAPSVCVAPVF